MKKQIIVIGTALMLIAIGLSGCTTTKTNVDKILGKWVGTASGGGAAAIINFFFNGSFSMSMSADRYYWGAYIITDETLAMAVQGDTTTWGYSFSNNDKELTLIDVKGEIPYWVLTKSTKTNVDKILGKWVGTASGDTELIMHFYPNGNVSFTANFTITWGAYILTDETLATMAMDAQGGIMAWEYSFSNNDNTLTLIGDEQLGLLILTRQ